MADSIAVRVAQRYRADATAQRVVARWERRSGLFQPPPAMVKAVGDWMRSVYAGHVWAKAKIRLQLLHGARVEAEAALDQLATFRKDLPKLIKQAIVKGPRSPGKATVIRFKLPEPSPLSFVLEVGFQPSGEFYGLTFKIEAFGKKSGWVNVEADVDGDFDEGRIDSWLGIARQRIEKLRDRPGKMDSERAYGKKLRELGMEEAFGGEGVTQNTKQRWVENQRVIQEAKKYTSGPKVYKSKASKNFPLDLTGWRYELTAEQEALAVKAILMTAQLNFRPRKKLLGTWTDMNRTLVIDIQGDPLHFEGFKNDLDSLQDTLIHELSHLGQLVMTLTKSPGGGSPSRNISDPKYDEGGSRRFPWEPGMDTTRQEYLLRGVEFYPWIRDGIRQFSRAIQKTKKEDRADAARIWVGEPTQDHKGPALNDWRRRVPDALWKPNELYTALKKKAPKMWQKAVKEFYKGVQPLL